MPYNTTPIAPPAEFTGTISLPLARVKKIIHADIDIKNCSNNAAFAITVATELFIQHMVEQTANVIRTDSKRVSRGRTSNVTYNDIANAVARVDNLEFLTDLVPKTISYKQYREKKATEASELAAGQQTLDQMGKSRRSAKDVQMVDPEETNGTGPLSPSQKANGHSSSPRAHRAAPSDRLSFDAVRDEHRVENDLPMEE